VQYILSNKKLKKRKRGGSAGFWGGCHPQTVVRVATRGAAGMVAATPVENQGWSKHTPKKIPPTATFYFGFAVTM
jgi:hypothetical protein